MADDACQQIKNALNMIVYITEKKWEHEEGTEESDSRSFK